MPLSPPKKKVTLTKKFSCLTMANKVAASLVMCLVLVAAVRLPTAAAQDAFSTTAKRNAKLVEEAVPSAR
ncbi:hypothetical protein QQP08_014186 [Theobroma cacao]|nr:hypothetical protein QQP08_014186 [Theobroma cacao]